MPDLEQLIKGFGLGLVGSRNPTLAAQIGQGWKQQAANDAMMDYRNRALQQAMQIARMEQLPKIMEQQRLDEAAAAQGEARGRLPEYEQQFVGETVQPDPLGPGTVGTPPRQLTQADLLEWARRMQSAGYDATAVNNLISQYGPKVVAEGAGLRTMSPLQPGGATESVQPYSPEKKREMEATATEKEATAGLRSGEASALGVARKRIDQAVAEGRMSPERADEAYMALAKRGGGVTTNIKLPEEKKALPAAQGIDLAAGLSGMRRLDRLLKSYDPGYVGPVTGRVNLMLSKLGLKSGDINTFRAETYNLINKIIKDITGAQMSENEAERIMNQVPKFEDPPDVWEKKFKALRAETEAIIQDKLYVLGRAYDVPAPDELMGYLKQQGWGDVAQAQQPLPQDVVAGPSGNDDAAYQQKLQEEARRRGLVQ